MNIDQSEPVITITSGSAADNSYSYITVVCVIEHMAIANSAAKYPCVRGSYLALSTLHSFFYIMYNIKFVTCTSPPN